VFEPHSLKLGGYFNMPRYWQEQETMSREELRRYEEKNFLEQVQHVFQNSKFYREKFAAANLHPGEINSLDDIKKIPFTVKEEIKEALVQKPPWGSNLSKNFAEVLRIHLTSGTTGKPIPLLDTKEDWYRFTMMYARDMYGYGIRSTDLFMPLFGFGPYIGFWAAWDAAQHIGCSVLANGGFTTEQRLELVTSYPVTAVGCTPSYAISMVEKAKEMGLDLKKEAHVRIIFHTGEPGASIDSTRKKVEEGWGAKCYDLIGSTEMGPWGFNCEAHSGLVHINEDWTYPEVLDIETGQPVQPGETGELILTQLHRKALPLIRYRTRDIIRVADRQCPCGRTLFSMEGGVIGRLDDMKKIRGMLVYPSKIEEVVRNFDEVIEYRVIIKREKGMDDIDVQVELRPELAGQDMRHLLEKIAGTLRVRIGIRINVKDVPVDSLPRWDFKAKRVVDTREDVPF
jgi:phenylacetate-CoA ligase